MSVRASLLTVESVITWHARRIAFYRAEILKGQEWSRENNDGHPDLAGTYYTDECPLLIREHQKIIRAYRSGKAPTRPITKKGSGLK
jgi:hypothetical protein